MTIIRPYGAVDNELNLMMREVIQNYLNKNNEEIEQLSIYECAVTAITASNRKISISKAEGCMGKTYDVRNYIYMKEEINGKWTRIKKSEW